MFNDKIIKPLRTRKKTIKICNFNQMDDKANELLMNYSTPKYMQNLHIDGGKLTGGVGLEEAKITFGPQGYFHLPEIPGKVGKQLFVYYRYDRKKNVVDNRLIVRTKSGEFYETSIYRPSNQYKLIENINSIDNVSAINYRYNNSDVILFCSKNMCLKMYDGEKMTTIYDAPRITSITEHYGRIFVSTYKEGDVWFSDDYNPVNWNVSLSEAGYIKFADKLGRTLKVISFNDYVYIFREHGIYRLTAIGDQRNFELTKVLEISGKIYDNSICQVMDKIVFLTNFGLYIFDGYSVKQVAKNISETTFILDETLVSSSMDNKYLLAYIGTNYDKGESGSINNRVIVYDIEKDILEINKGISIRDMTPVKVNHTTNSLVLLNNDTVGKVCMFNFNGKLYNKDLKFQYDTINSYLGNYDKIKYIRKIRIITKNNINFVLNIDGTKYEFQVAGSNKLSEIKVMKKGKQIGFSISGFGMCNISGMEIEYDEVI